MEQLEFALVPIGIVLGYGVTRVLASWAHIIRLRNQHARAPVLFISATALSTYLMYANFAGLWAYRSVDFEVSVGIFSITHLVIVTLPMLLFMLAVSVVAPPNIDDIRDLENHYFESARAFYIVLCGAMLASFLPDILLGIHLDMPAFTPLILCLVFFALLALAWVKSRAVHWSVHAALWSLILAVSILRPLET